MREDFNKTSLEIHSEKRGNAKNKENGQLMRNKLLEATEYLFYKQGIFQISLQDIAQRPATVSGAICQHLRTRPSLLTPWWTTFYNKCRQVFSAMLVPHLARAIETLPFVETGMRSPATFNKSWVMRKHSACLKWKRKMGNKWSHCTQCEHATSAWKVFFCGI